MAEKEQTSLVDDRATIGAAKAAARPQLHSESSNPNMNGPLYRQTAGSNVILVRRLKRKDEGTWKQVARWFVENQIGMSYSPRTKAPSQFTHASALQLPCGSDAPSACERQSSVRRTFHVVNRLACSAHIIETLLTSSRAAQDCHSTFSPSSSYPMRAFLKRDRTHQNSFA